MVCFGIAEVQIASHRIALHCGDSRDVSPYKRSSEYTPRSMACYDMPCHAMPCHAMKCCACYDVQCCHITCCAILCFAMTCFTELSSASHCCVVSCCDVLCLAVQLQVLAALLEQCPA